MSTPQGLVDDHSQFASHMSTPRLLVIGSYRMGVEISPENRHATGL